MMILLVLTILLFFVISYIYFNKNMNDISKKILLKGKLDDNIRICKEMLKMLGNEHTKVEYNNDENSNLSYYNHTKDIVVMKRREDDARVINIAHECIHTIQNRKYLNANKFFSNLQLGYFFTLFIYSILYEKFEIELIFIQLLILLGTFFAKVVIEGDASYRSIGLAEKFLNTKIERDVTEEYISNCKKIIYESMAIYYLNFFSQGMLMLIINMIIMLIF